LNNFKLAKNYFLVGLKNSLEYKYLIFTQTFSHIISLIITYGLWYFIFSFGYSQIQSFTLIEFVIYYASNTFISSLITDVDQTLSADINSGELLQYLLRNINPIIKNYFKLIGRNFFVIVILFFLLIALTIFYSKLTLINFIIFLFFLIISITLHTLFRGIIGTIAFKTEKINGFRSIILLIINFLEGGWIPLTFFSESIQKTFSFLPFQYMKYFPTIILLDKTNYSNIFWGCVISIIWIIILYVIFKISYKKGLKSFQANGG